MKQGKLCFPQLREAAGEAKPDEANSNPNLF
jgi:hypothetical protein